MLKCRAFVIMMAVSAIACGRTCADQAQVAISAVRIPADDLTSTNGEIPVHRVVLLEDDTEHASDALVRQIYKQSVDARTQRKRRTSLPTLPQNSAATPRTPTTFAVPGKSQKVKPEATAHDMSQPQFSALSGLLLRDTIVDRLEKRYRISVVRGADVDSALKGLHVKSAKQIEIDQAQALCQKFDVDAVIIVDSPVVTETKGITDDFIVRVRVRLAALRDPHGGFVSYNVRGKTQKSSKTHAPTTLKAGFEFTVAGAAQSYRALLKSGYSTDPDVLIQNASQATAELALHALATGKQPPMMEPNTHVAIAPVLAPDTADSLIFSATGRRTESDFVRGLPVEDSEYFHPDLLPVISSEVISSQRVVAALRASKHNMAALWNDAHTPNINAVCQLGSSLHVEYVLLARITDIEAAVAPPTEAATGTTPASPAASDSWLRKAHAEAVGALVQVSSGTIVWTDRGETTVTSRERVTAESEIGARKQICLQAEKFALIDLKRQLSHFISDFRQ